MMVERPARSMTPEEIQAYRRDGVVCLRGLYSAEWVEKLTRALDEIYGRGGFAMPGISQAFRSDAFTWMTHDGVRDFVLGAPSAYVAQQAMGSEKVNFFYDQVFIKPALTPDPTPWHHDATFWPLAGDQIVSLWTSVDAVDAESSALEFIAGSHLWEQRWKPVGIGGVVISREPLEALPDIDADRSKYDILSWAVEPGDALLFHARTVHGSRGNRSANKGRRAIATRWCGDDVVYRPIEGQMPIVWRHGREPGEHLDGFVFPRVLPDLDAQAIEARMQDPVYPDIELATRAAQQLATAERVPVRMDI